MINALWCALIVYAIAMLTLIFFVIRSNAYAPRITDDEPREDE